MDMEKYVIIGTLLAVFAGLSITGLFTCIWLYTKQDRKLYKRRQDKTIFPSNWIQMLRETYHTTQSIYGMLDLIGSKDLNKKVKKRVLAAQDYLKNSKYKDFETALKYVSNETEEFQSFNTELILNEVLKRKRIEMKPR